MQTRRAIENDAALIAAHRRAMFAEMGGREAAVLDEVERNCVGWTERMIRDQRYFGFITADSDAIAASAGLLLLDWPPHPLDPAGDRRAYILNVYVEPAYRRRGLAKALVEMCRAEAARQNIRVVTLHASEAGRPLYESLGFRATNEMMLTEAPGPATSR